MFHLQFYPAFSDCDSLCMLAGQQVKPYKYFMGVKLSLPIHLRSMMRRVIKFALLQCVGRMRMEGSVVRFPMKLALIVTFKSVNLTEIVDHFNVQLLLTR